MQRNIILIIIFLTIAIFLINCSKRPQIDIWYGKSQHFGKNGIPQKWINVLGRVSSLGDFNVEIDYNELKMGNNILILTASDANGYRNSTTVKVVRHHSEGCPMPYSINWSAVNHILEIVQVVDGLWELNTNGIRIFEPYYDRVIGFGDLSWKDYEVTVMVTFHGMRIPVRGQDGGAGVIHAAIAVRWPGHDDDNNQPRVKWYPLGATAEFRLKPDLKNCSWRILGGGNKVAEENKTRTIQYNVPYMMKHRVKSISDTVTQYVVKLWEADQPEPVDWDVQMLEGADDIRRGGALIIAHYTDVTFGNIRVEPIE
jgi:hypothetical protein